MTTCPKYLLTIGLVLSIALSATQESAANTTIAPQKTQKEASRKQTSKRKRSRRQRRSERRRKLEEQRDRERLQAGWVEYRGNVIDPESFRKKCKKIAYKDLKSKRRDLSGLAVQMLGQIDKIEKGSLQLLITESKKNNRWKDPVTINTDKIKYAEYRKGQIVEIWGIAEKRQKVEAWFSSLVPPGVNWKYNLRLTSGVNKTNGLGRRGRSRLRDRRDNSTLSRIKRSYLVDGVVTNTAKQPIRRLLVSVRLYQPDYRLPGNAAKQSGFNNDLVQKFILENIQPGRSKPFAVPFELLDIAVLDVGQNTRPIVEIKILNYEL